MWQLVPVDFYGLALTTVGWVAAHFVLKGISTVCFSSVYSKLDTKNRADWDITMPAFVHAILSTVFAYVAVSDTFPGQPADPWWTSTPFQRFAIQFTLAYILLDSALLAWYWNLFPRWEYVIHHAIFPVTYGIGLYIIKPPFGLYVMLVMQLAEATTPLLHVRFYLTVTGRKDGVLYKIASLAFAVLFLLIRVAMCSYMLFNMYAVLDNPLYVSSCGPLCSVILSGAVPFLALQYMWGFKLASTLVAVAMGKPKPSKKKAT